MYTSHIAVVEFVEALGTWVEESLLKRLKKASYYSIMADECTDVTTVEELSVFCRWEEDGLPVEHFLEIVHLQQVDALSIHSALIKCLKKKYLQVGGVMEQPHSRVNDLVLGSNEEVCTPCSFCALPLPYVAFGLRSSCKFNTWN